LTILFQFTLVDSPQHSYIVGYYEVPKFDPASIPNPGATNTREMTQQADHEWIRPPKTILFTKDGETVTCCSICFSTIRNGQSELGRNMMALDIDEEVKANRLSKSEADALSRGRLPPPVCPDCYTTYQNNPKKSFWRYLYSDKSGLLRFLYVLAIRAIILLSSGATNIVSLLLTVVSVLFCPQDGDSTSPQTRIALSQNLRRLLASLVCF
jgi:hypothetical protein